MLNLLNIFQGHFNCFRLKIRSFLAHSNMNIILFLVHSKYEHFLNSTQIILAGDGNKRV